MFGSINLSTSKSLFITKVVPLLCILFLFASTSHGQGLNDNAPLPLDLKGSDVIKWEVKSGLREANGDAVVIIGLTTLHEFSIYESKLTITPPIDHVIKKNEYPESSTAKDPETGEDLKVYKEGNFILTLAPKSIDAVHKNNIILSLKYIACTDKVCLFPTRQKLDIPLTSIEPVNLASLDFESINNPSDPAAVTSDINATADSEKNHNAEGEVLFEEDAPPVGLMTSLFYAFVGGLILNLMPCVFPMLGIKVMSVVKKAGATKRTIRLSGVLYTLGVVVSFVVFGLIIATLKSFGTTVGWGFQLQSPIFIALLSVLFVLMALNFFGFFEFGVPAGLVPQSWMKNRDGLMGEFMAGVMVAIVASPCTAPFMATALGFALAQPAAIMILIFTFLGFGLGAPFLLLTFFPSLTKFLPQPGNWMITFRQLLAFPLLLTSAGLVWIFAKLTNPDQVLSLLALCIAVTFVIWLYHSTKNKGTASRTILLALAFIPLALSAKYTFTIDPSKNTKTKEVSEDGRFEKHGVRWHTFTPTIAEKLVAEGKTVFIDFTASWCLTCQANAKTVFGSSKVRDYVNNNDDVALVYADWTDGNEEITVVLEKFKAPGVPLYLVYKPGKDVPKKLPQILTPGIFLDALK